MGFLKKITKSISKGLKKIVSLPVTVTKAAWGGIKRAWNSKIGRIALIAAAIWVGGAFLAASLNGVAFSSAITSGQAVMEGWQAAGGVVADKLGLSTVESTTAATSGASDAAAGGAITASTPAPVSGALSSWGGPASDIGLNTGAGAGASSGLGAGAGASTAAGTGAANVAAGEAGAAATDAGSSAGWLTSAKNFVMSPGGGLATSAGLMLGGNMLAAANTPSQAEEYQQMIASQQAANNLSGMQSGNVGGGANAYFSTPQFGQPAQGLLQPKGSTYGY
jgi:hypothetical protein